MKLTNILLTACLCALSLPLSGEVRVERLLVENMDGPTVVERAAPRLSWNLSSSSRNVMQTAYRIIVCSSPEKAAACEGDIWDSGWVASDETILVPYGGARIPQNTAVWWRVKSFTTDGESPWSEPSTWSTGLYSFKAWNAYWIGVERATPADHPEKDVLAARYLRTEFSSEGGVRRATAFISGLGWYELFINGERIGDQELAPSPTDYRQTQHYNGFDVTGQIVSGKNAIGVTLGSGCYFAMRQAKPYKNNSFGYPKLLFTLIIEYADGSVRQISSNERWKATTDGPITAANEYDGEDYDARKEMKGWDKPGFDDSAWRNAERTQIPIGELRGMMHPFMKVMKTLRPVGISKLSEGKWIMDMGQNFTGWLDMKVKGPAGTKVTLRFAETLKEDGSLNTANLRNAKATDNYTLSGAPEGERWHPSFTYHGFRYVEISGWPGVPTVDDFTGEVIFDGMETIGSFETDNATLNAVTRNAWWGFASNYKGMPVDCPQRNERQPWLGDRIRSTFSESYIFDNEALYDKWTADIVQAQRYDGSIPDVAPAFWNYYSDNMTWPSTLPFAVEMLYKRWGNIEPIQRSYAPIRKWLDYMKTEYMGEDYIISKDSYGDWCMPPESPEIIHSKDPARITDPGLIATSFYCKMLEVMTEFASLTGNEADIPSYAELRAKMCKALNDKYFNPEGYYSNNTTTANLLPLVFGLVPEGREDDVCRHIVAKVASSGFRTSGGVLCAQWHLTELCKRGRPDVAYAIATATGYPSWGYMVSKGATTIWELFNGDTADSAMNSGNHVMIIGDMLDFCYGNLAGIQAAEPGFKTIRIAPEFGIDDLGEVKASYRSVRGLIESSWKRTNGKIRWKVTVPAGTKAVLVYPDREETVGSGTYDITFDYHDPAHQGVIEEGLVYRDAPYPQCHATTLVQMKDGRIGAAWFGGHHEGADDVCIWFSAKDPKTSLWSEPVMAAHGILSDTLRKACYNPVLWQSDKGPLYIYFKIGKNVRDWTGWYTSSRNNGKTWAKRQRINDGLLGPIKDKPVQVGGKVVAGSSIEEGGWRVNFQISEDGGKTWRRTPDIPAKDAEQTRDYSMRPIQAIQPSIIELPDGTLRAYCRTLSGLMGVTESKDGGETWSDMDLSDMPNNNSGLDAVRLKDGRYLMVYNKVRTARGTPKGDRTPLNLAISDDGVTWYDSITLEDSPISQYSYPAIICDKDGFVHISYTWRRLKVKYMMIDPSKLPVGERLHFE